jgi:hypothetical protein
MHSAKSGNPDIQRNRRGSWTAISASCVKLGRISGTPQPWLAEAPGFSTLMLTLLSATSAQAFRVSCSSSACRGKGGARFNSKPSNVRKFVTGADHRICRSHTHSRFSELDRALDNCRGILDHLRQVDLPVALIRMLDQSAFQPRQVAVHGLYGEVYEATDWIASTPPCRLGNGQNAGAEFGRTFACSPCHPRRLQVCPSRPRRP